MLGGWVKTQVKLMGVTFLVLTAGLMILGVDYPVLLGLLIALIDALPVFGSGTVLIPWGLFVLLSGNSFLGVGLLCLYGAAFAHSLGAGAEDAGQADGARPSFDPPGTLRRLSVFLESWA